MLGFKAELVLNRFELWTALFWPELPVWVSLVLPKGSSGSVKIRKVLNWCEPGSNCWTAELLSTVSLLMHKFMKNTITVQVSCDSPGKFNRLSTLCCLSTVLYTYQSQHTEKGGNICTSCFSMSQLVSNCSFGVLLLLLLWYTISKLGCTQTPQDNMTPTLLLPICW